MNRFAIYFPQFYPTEINNRAWGHGFTDWALVADANLRERWARRAPALGFYDGSRESVHEQQIQTASAAGLTGFGLYHYWFYDSHELKAFEETMLRRQSAAQTPFKWFLIWATENWSKRWIGDATRLATLAEHPSAEQIDRHCEHLLACFSSPGYERIGGRPLLCIYNLAHFSHPEETLARYRERLSRLGSDVFIAHFIKNPFDFQYASLVDGNYLFEPRLFFGANRRGRGTGAKRVFDGFRKLAGDALADRALTLLDRVQQKGQTFSAEAFLRYMSSEERKTWIDALKGPVQNILSPGWNNTPRYRERFTALEALSRDQFCELLQAAERKVELPLMVNAWNEWSEGAAIEPCAYFGTRYLDALGRTAPST